MLQVQRTTPVLHNFVGTPLGRFLEVYFVRKSVRSVEYGYIWFRHISVNDDLLLTETLVCVIKCARNYRVLQKCETQTRALS